MTLNVQPFPNPVQIAGSFTTVWDSLNVFGAFRGGTGNNDVWAPKGVRTWATVVSVFSIVSSNINDTIAGTGARKVAISGLDENFIPVVEVVEMNGTTPVDTVGEFIRLNEADVIEVGEHGGTGTSSNKGDITITHKDSGNTEGMIPFDVSSSIGFGTNGSTHFTIPKDHLGCIIGFTYSSDKSVPSDIFLHIRPSDVVAPFSPIITAGFIAQVEGANQFDFSNDPIEVTEKTDIWLSADSNANTDVQAVISVILYDFSRIKRMSGG